MKFSGVCMSGKVSEADLLEQHRAVLRAAPVGIGVVVNRVFTDVNERLCEMVGYAAAELIGKSARMLYPSDEEFEYVGREKYRLIQESGTGAVETRWKCRNETIIDVWLSSTPIDRANLERGVVFTVLDISAWKRDREALIAGEKKFRAYFESAPVGVFVVDANGVCLDANLAGATMLGYSVADAIGRNVADAFSPVDLATGLAEFAALKVTGNARVDIGLKRSDDALIFAHIDALRLDGNRFIGFLTDITEKTRLERALFDAHETFAKVFDNTFDIITITEFGTGRLIEANSSIERLARRSKSELLGKTPVEMGLWADPADFERFREILHRDGRVVGYETAFDTGENDGRIIGSVSSERMAIAGRDCVVTIVRNITERKNMESALAASVQRLRRYFESSPVGMFVANREGRYLDVNPAGCRMLGYSREEFLATSVFQLVAPESLTAAEEHFAKVVNEGHATGDFALHHCDGRTVHVRLDAVRLEDGTAIAFATDLTDHVYLENELRETRDRFRKVFESTMDAIAITVAGTGQILAVNECFERRTGYLRNELIGRRHEELGLWAKPEQLEPLREQMLEHGRITDAEVDFRSRSGENITGSVSAQLMEFYGHPCALIVIRDITERKRIEMELAASERRFRQLFDEMRTGFALHEIILDGEGKPADYRWLMVNPAFERLTGITADMCIGRNASEVIPELDPYWIETYGRVALTGEPEDMVQRASSIGRWYETRSYSPAPGLFAVLFHDVTDRMESEEIALAIRDMSVEIAASRDLAAALDVCLQSAVRVAEGDAGAVMLVGENGAFETVAHRGLPDDFADKLRVLGPDTEHVRLIAAGKPVFSTHAVLTRNWDKRLPPGAFRAVAVIPLVHEAKVVGCLTVVSFTRDEFAPRRREALVGAGSQIAQTIVRWRTENERLRLEEQLRAAAKMEAIGRLAGGVAHDFNNILTSIRGYAELLLRSVRDEDPMAEDLKEITKAADRAASLTQQLLAFSRKQIIEPRLIDLNEVIASSNRMLERMIGEDIELVFVPGAHLTAVRADPVQMEQVLINLGVNARDAMPAGGRLTIETANAVVDRDYASRNHDTSPGAYAMMSVRDTGHGMSDEVRERIFEPFFTTKEQGKGTGLGLATVYGIARQNGGFITVDSRPDESAEFRFYLPAIREGVRAAKTPEMPAAPGGAETILVVEDEDAVRRLARRVLERNGYHVIEAGSGDEALAIGDDVTIHLVLSDVVMPRMNGRELVERLLVRRPGLRVLFMSGYTEDAIARHGVLETGTAFVQKPFTAGDLARKVRETLDR